MHHLTNRIAHMTAFVTPVVEHWLERMVLTMSDLLQYGQTKQNHCFPEWDRSQDVRLPRTCLI